MSPTKLFRGVNWFIIQVFGNAKGRTKLDLDLKLGISNIYSSQARDNHDNNHTFNQVEKNFIHGSSSTHDAGVNFNTNQTYEEFNFKDSEYSGSLDRGEVQHSVGTLFEGMYLLTKQEVQHALEKYHVSKEANYKT